MELRQISPEALVSLIEKHEGLSLIGYLPTPNDKPTAGYGHTGPDVQIGESYSLAQAQEWLQQDLQWAEQAVTDSIVHLPFTQHQYDACVSLCYNIGISGFANSTVAHRLNMGDVQGAADAFLMWDKQHGTVLQGLLNRREDERLWFLSPDGDTSQSSPSAS